MAKHRITNKKSQVAVETLMVLGIIMLLLLPATYLFFNFINTSSQQILNAQINQVGKTIVGNAEMLYYYGRDAAIIVEFSMPTQVTKISVEENINLKYYSLVFFLNNDREKVFVSPVRLMVAHGSDLNKDPLEGRKVFKLTNADGKTITIERIV
ncbi:hypothetical protein HYY69_00240 [Candidatus Woesearchaeota archaeon]|nr:hypothetical protein [Candidatus Woesearchaeota archaeon]